MRSAPTTRRALFASLAVAGLLSSACGDDQDPAGAADLWQRIQAAPGYRSWSRAPAVPERIPSFTAHADAIELFINKPMADTFTAGQPITEWPVGSIVVKDGFKGDTLKIVAVMEKRPDGWFFAEYNGDGDTLFSGRPKVCTGCHDNRKDYSDWVYSIELPR